MTLDVNKQEMTIMGVKFESRADFRGVWYVMSSSMIEGRTPKVQDVIEMKEYILNKRLEVQNA